MRLRLQLIIMTTVLVALTVTVSSYFFAQQEREVLLQEMTRRGATIARNLATISTDPLVGNDSLALATFVESTLRNDGVAYAMILDEKGTVLAHDRIENVGRSYVEPTGVRPLTNESILIQPYRNEAKEPMLDITLPITLRNGVRIGTVHVGMSQKANDKIVAQALREAAYIAAGLLLIGVIISVFFTQLILRPLHDLVRGAQALGEGDLNYRLRLPGPPVLGLLGKG